MGKHTASVAGEIPRAYLEKRTDFGRRICGWVAANRVTALNSIAELDFDDAAGAGGLLSSLVCPLFFDNELIGVVGFYAKSANAFSKTHQAVAEDFGTVLVKTLRPAIEAVESMPLPSKLDQLISQVEGTPSWPVGVIVIRWNSSVNSAQVEEDIRLTLRRAIRAEDSLVRVDNDAFLLLLLRSDNVTTRTVAARIQEELASQSAQAVIEWASVDRGPNAENQAFASLADAIRHTALDTTRTNRTAH